MRLGEYAESYIAMRFSLASGSQDQLRQSVRILERWAGRPIDLADLTAELLNAWLASLLKAGRSPATINSRRRELLTLWRSAASKGLCAPPGEVGRAREPRRLPQALPISDLERLVSFCRTLRGTVAEIPESAYWPSLLLAQYGCGARIGALRRTRTADVNLADRYLIVRAETQKQLADQLFYLPDQAIAAIAGIYCPHRELLWPWPHHPKYFSQRISKLFKLAGVKSAGAHCGLTHAIRRRTLTTCWAVDPAIAQRQAGHADGRTTQTHYVDPRESRGKSAADILPELHIASSANRQLMLF